MAFDAEQRSTVPKSHAPPLVFSYPAIPWECGPYCCQLLQCFIVDEARSSAAQHLQQGNNNTYY